MICIHGPGNNTVDYVISSIFLINQINNIDIIYNHLPHLDHKRIVLTLNLYFHTKPNYLDMNNGEHPIFG
jgi:hypothetical protein